MHTRAEVEVGFDVLLSRNARGRRRATGAGDTSATIEVHALFERGSRPAVSFIYTLSLPTASAEKNLGSGRASHLAFASVEKTVKGGTLGLDVGPGFAGRRNSDGFITTGQAEA